jgi:hypothetical protein
MNGRSKDAWSCNGRIPAIRARGFQCFGILKCARLDYTMYFNLAFFTNISYG